MKRLSLFAVSILFLVCNCLPTRHPATEKSFTSEKESRLNAEIKAMSEKLDNCQKSLLDTTMELEKEQTFSGQLRDELSNREREFSSLQRELSLTAADLDSARERITKAEEGAEDDRKVAREYRDALIGLQSSYAVLNSAHKSAEKEIALLHQKEIPKSFRKVDELLTDLPFGNVVFKTPPHMYVGDIAPVNLAISLAEGIEELKRRIRSLEGETRATVEVAQVQLGDITVAHLSGSKGLNVRSTDETEERLISSVGTQEWSWEVEAVERGTHLLHLSVSAIFRVEGSDRTHTLETFRREINVEVLPPRALGNFLKRNWQWIWTALVVPASVAVWEYWKRRKLKKRP